MSETPYVRSRAPLPLAVRQDSRAPAQARSRRIIMLNSAERRFLFIGCFISLIATSFGFISREFMLEDWQVAFNLSEAQKGGIFGAGL